MAYGDDLPGYNDFEPLDGGLSDGLMDSCRCGHIGWYADENDENEVLCAYCTLKQKLEQVKQAIREEISREVPDLPGLLEKVEKLCPGSTLTRT